MKIIKKLLFTVLLCFGHSAFASPLQEKTLDEFFKVSDIKAITLNSFKESDLKDIGVTKEEFWKKFEKKKKKIYFSQTTEEELLKSIEYYKSPEVQSLTKKMPMISQLSNQITARILLSYALNKAQEKK